MLINPANSFHPIEINNIYIDIIIDISILLPLFDTNWKTKLVNLIKYMKLLIQEQTYNYDHDINTRVVLDFLRLIKYQNDFSVIQILAINRIVFNLEIILDHFINLYTLYNSSINQYITTLVYRIRYPSD